MQNSLKEKERQFIINTYNRKPESSLLIMKGESLYVWDERGNKYLDFVGGLAVNALGHCHPKIVEMIKQQVSNLVHTSNLYYTAPQIRLAELLVNNSVADKVFFANSGAEANEAAIKLARKYAYRYLGEEKHEIITAYNSFHGRTMATITATGQAKYQEGFKPLLPGFRHAHFNDLDDFKSQINEHTCGIMIEPIQGEGGVYPATVSFIRGLRELCNRHNLLLIFDEVQCGMGRTGHLFAYQLYGVEPDIFTLAKALGGGTPIGVMLAKDKIAQGFGPGDHASTFGGNPVTCAAAIAVLEVLLDKGFLENVQHCSDYFIQQLNVLKKRYPQMVKDVRGAGLIIGLELKGDALSVQKKCQEKSILVNCIGERIIRFLPPLIVEEKQIKRVVTALEQIFSDEVKPSDA